MFEDNVVPFGQEKPLTKKLTSPGGTDFYQSPKNREARLKMPFGDTYNRYGGSPGSSEAGGGARYNDGRSQQEPVRGGLAPMGGLSPAAYRTITDGGFPQQGTASPVNAGSFFGSVRAPPPAINRPRDNLGVNLTIREESSATPKQGRRRFYEDDGRRLTSSGRGGAAPDQTTGLGPGGAAPDVDTARQRTTTETRHSATGYEEATPASRNNMATRSSLVLVPDSPRERADYAVHVNQRRLVSLVKSWISACPTDEDFRQKFSTVLRGLGGRSASDANASNIVSPRHFGQLVKRAFGGPAAVAGDVLDAAGTQHPEELRWALSDAVAEVL